MNKEFLRRAGSRWESLEARPADELEFVRAAFAGMDEMRDQEVAAAVAAAEDRRRGMARASRRDISVLVSPSRFGWMENARV